MVCVSRLTATAAAAVVLSSSPVSSSQSGCFQAKKVRLFPPFSPQTVLLLLLPRESVCRITQAQEGGLKGFPRIRKKQKPIARSLSLTHSLTLALACSLKFIDISITFPPSLACLSVCCVSIIRWHAASFFLSLFPCFRFSRASVRCER